MMNQDIFIQKHKTIKEALKQLDKVPYKTLLVVDDKQRLIGTLSDGDIRRFILNNGDLNKKIEGIYNPNPISFKEGSYGIANIKKAMITKGIGLVPIINGDDVVTNYLTWSEIFSNEKADFHNSKKINVPVVIMAGGKGSRLEPFTNIFPKALIPIGDRTVVESIMSEFMKFGINKFVLTVNYKAQLIESYFNTVDKNYEIKYVREADYLGTAGSLHLMRQDLKGDFIVSNCDIIVKADYADVLDFHQKQKSSLTILSSIQHHKIPYGVVNFIDGGRVISIQEKPEFSFTINTGVYLLNSDILDLIPANTKYDMPDLIDKIKENGGRVFTYPVNENDYIDIGQWEEYKKMANKTGG